MMLVGSHIQIRQTFGSKTLLAALRNILISVGIALGLALVIVRITGIDHLGIYVLIMASSSAAVVLPLVSNSAAATLNLLVTQVAAADLLGIVALPTVMEPANTPMILVGAISVTACAGLIYLALRIAQRNGTWLKLREVSRERRFGLELRISLLVLLGLATLAQSFGLSVMIAGFSLGMAIAANGVPHRLAKQLFAVTEGLFAPVFYVLLGATIDFRLVFVDTRLILLALLLAGFGVVSHLSGMMFGQRFSQAGLSAAALGIPTAVVSIGLTTNAISSAEGAAITLAMLLSVVLATLFARKVQEG
jgi:Kef-type K+ transport system membrane component KefB